MRRHVSGKQVQQEPTLHDGRTRRFGLLYRLYGLCAITQMVTVVYRSFGLPAALALYNDIYRRSRKGRTIEISRRETTLDRRHV